MEPDVSPTEVIRKAQRRGCNAVFKRMIIEAAASAREGTPQQYAPRSHHRANGCRGHSVGASR
jgi:hypothetical protein